MLDYCNTKELLIYYITFHQTHESTDLPIEPYIKCTSDSDTNLIELRA